MQVAPVAPVEPLAKRVTFRDLIGQQIRPKIYIDTSTFSRTQEVSPVRSSAMQRLRKELYYPGLTYGVH